METQKNLNTFKKTSEKQNRYLDRSRVQGSCKLLRLGLAPLDHRHRQQVRVHPRVEVQDLADLVLGLLAGPEGGVALLPQELPRADERRRVLELPPHDVCPLVEPQGEVAPRADPVGEVGVPEKRGGGERKEKKREGRKEREKKREEEEKRGEILSERFLKWKKNSHHGLRGRADRYRAVELRLAGFCHPRDLGGELGFFERERERKREEERKREGVSFSEKRWRPPRPPEERRTKGRKNQNDDDDDIPLRRGPSPCSACPP